MILEGIDTEVKIGRAFKPMYPWVFVRLLEKEQKHGSIILVDGKKQNKITHEAIVLSTWEPTQRPVKGGGTILQISELKPGDHVLFPHWCGLPVIGYNDQKYRIVKECDWTVDRDGGIIGVVEDGVSEEEMVAKIDEVLQIGDTPRIVLRELLKRFMLIDRSRTSVTISGL